MQPHDSMNQLMRMSTEARAQLQEATGLDDLDYNLLLLETGCACLETLVRPVNVAVSQEASDAYREHMAHMGWWSWFEMQWRQWEIRMAAEWFGPESLVPHQDNAWRRERLLAEAASMHRTERYWRAFDVWVKLLEEGGALRITLPKPTNQPHPTHVHH